MLKFTVVTPCFNARERLVETMASVLNQSAFMHGQHTLEYIVIDGGSTDGTQEYLRTLNDPRLSWISEKDTGMYDALAKGFTQGSGQIFSYINAGDIYFPGAFDVVSEAFTDTSLNWLTGLTVLQNEKGQVIQVAKARRYWPKLIQKGAYGPYLPFIQQESTFWRAELLATVNMERLRKLRLVGDYYLWVCMATKWKLDVVNSTLAAFRIHDGQLSEAKDQYFQELEKVCNGKVTLFDKVLILSDKIMATLPAAVARRLGYPNAIEFDLGHKRWMKS